MAHAPERPNRACWLSVGLGVPVPASLTHDRTAVCDVSGIRDASCRASSEPVPTRPVPLLPCIWTGRALLALAGAAAAPLQLARAVRMADEAPVAEKPAKEDAPAEVPRFDSSSERVASTGDLGCSDLMFLRCSDVCSNGWL